MNRFIFVSFDQLNASHGALRNADKSTDHVVLVESSRMIHGRPWHRQRLHFLISSARHFAQEMQLAGWKTTYLKADTTVAGLQEIKAENPQAHVVCGTPHSYRLRRSLLELGVQFIENDFFLTTTEQFEDWASKHKSLTMESFYRTQRKRLGILMAGNEPLGGAWNFDADNRLPPSRNHDWGSYLHFDHDEIDQQVLAEIPDSAWGNLEGKTWGTTRTEALAQLDHFLEHHFAQFGPYEDAMPQESWAGHHSLLSPYINNGLLHPSEVVDAALARFERGDIPIASCEGFIRQVIGWREYVNGMYWLMGDEYRSRNDLRASAELPEAFRDPKATRMSCVSTVISDVHERGWTHHIPRLMVLGNLALLAGVEPQALLDWMRESFVDASDWVMVPNIIGMAMHADGGTMMTKPYIAGGAYISRMGQFCKPCPYNPKNRTGEDACPFTALYWDFLDRHRAEFGGNHRMAQQYSLLNRLTDLEEIRQRAREVRIGLHQATI